MRDEKRSGLSRASKATDRSVLRSSETRPPVQAHLRFLKDAAKLRSMTLAQRFEHIFKTNLWGGEESRSGVGSAVTATTKLRSGLLQIIEQTKSRVLLDIPCGDFNWITEIADAVEQYIGADIVRELVDRNTRLYATANRKFMNLDLTRDQLPRADLVLCRDCLVHLSLDSTKQAIRNLRQSGSKWLLATTFTGIDVNSEIEDGDWRPLNMQAEPFYFPDPDKIIVEGCREVNGAYRDKSLGLWMLASLPSESASPGSNH